MPTYARALVTVLLTATGVVVMAAPATAAPSCVAQSVATEHQASGHDWGHDTVDFLATHPEILQAYGFRSFGELGSYAATQPHTSCPEDL